MGSLNHSPWKPAPNRFLAPVELFHQNELSCPKTGLYNPPQLAMRNIVYFDLETQKSAQEVGGWDNIREMRMSVGVTFSTRRNGYKIYPEAEVNDLINELLRADLVVGFNVYRFDYEVLHGYSVIDLRQIPTLDILIDLQKVINHRLSMDAVAASTLGLEKTSEGLQAIEWFRQGKLIEIAEYCCYDVKITRLLHEFGMAHQQLYYRNRFGARLSAQLPWKRAACSDLDERSLTVSP
jgi:hypothetical protein